MRPIQPIIPFPVFILRSNRVLTILEIMGVPSKVFGPDWLLGILLPTPPEGGKEVPLFILKSVRYLSLCNPLECGMGLSFEFRDYLASLPLSAETVSTNEHINLS